MDADFLLIRKMKQGQDEAFDTFVHKYYGDILRYCAYRCRDPEYALDLTQETFVRFFARLSEYRHKGKAKNYLYTIAGNLCKNWRQKDREIPTEEEVFVRETDPAALQEGGIVDKLLLEWAIDQLPPELQEVIDHYYFQEQKIREIAAELELGVPLVKYRLSQAKLKLRELLGKEEDHESGRTDTKL